MAKTSDANMPASDRQETFDAAIRRAQALIRFYLREPTNLIDELIAERRQSAALE
jgi:hypothetical protein